MNLDRERVSAFILEYLEIISDSEMAYLGSPANGLLRDVTIRQGIKMLLEAGVFDSPRDMREQALRDHDVILPWELFKEA